MTTTSEPTDATAGMPPRRLRRRTARFALPRQMPVAVRALWRSASREAQTVAHERAQALLALWLGTRSKAEVAAELEVTPLRVWQMSQAALCGLVCGLLPQPRTRRGREVTTMGGEAQEDPRALRRELERTRRELEVARRLIEVLRGLPGNAPRTREGERRDGETAEDGTSRRRPSPGRPSGRGS